MNRLVELIATGAITVEDLVNAQELIDRADLVSKGIDACKKSIVFTFKEERIDCYDYVDSTGEYKAWGYCTYAGEFICYSNWGRFTCYRSVLSDQFWERLHGFREQCVRRRPAQISASADRKGRNKVIHENKAKYIIFFPSQEGFFLFQQI